MGGPDQSHDLPAGAGHHPDDHWVPGLGPGPGQRRSWLSSKVSDHQSRHPPVGGIVI